MGRSGVIRQVVDGDDLDLGEIPALQGGPKDTPANPSKAVDPHFD
jgi:hypothetical protein